MASQEIYRDCYRGRQTVLHHMSYMRMSKVLLAISILAKSGIDLGGKKIFDYGFGAGTFFRYCPRGAKLFGVEIDPENVSAVREMLNRKGYESVCLDSVDLEKWETHPLIQGRYDVFLCSHVLEHLPDPVAFLCRVSKVVADDGAFVGLVPLNERRANPHHLHTVDEAKIRSWAAQSGLNVSWYLEGDPWTYWVQPLFTRSGLLSHKVAQAISLVLGVPATLLGYRFWGGLGRVVGLFTLSRPTQAAFILTRCRVS